MTHPTDILGRPIELTGGGDPTVPHLEMNPRRLAAAVGDPGGPARVEGALLPNVARADFTGTTSRAALVDAGLLDRITTRPWWHAHSTPDPVAAAWAELQPHMDRILELGDEMAFLDNLDAQDDRAAEQAAYEAVSTGKRPPKVKVADRTADRKAIRAEAAALLRHLRGLRRRYDAVVLEHGATWRAALLEGYSSLQPAANAAWGGFRGALATWQIRTMALAEMNHALDPSWETYRSNAQVRLLDDVTAALQAVDRLMLEHDVNLSGAYVTDPLHVFPPVWQRREWFLSGDPQVMGRLAQEEAAEDYRITSFTGPGGQV